MEALIRPEFGLMFWTILIFCLLVLILSRTAWKPLMKAVEERERGIRHDREAAEKARTEAEHIRTELDARLAAFKAETERRLEEVSAEGHRERDLIIEEAHRSAALLTDSAKKELEAQKNDLENQLRSRVGELAFMAAEKVLFKTIDQKANKELVGQFLKDLEGKDPKYRLGR
jgi:F-type H+-transporting ATPase subunit b